MVQGRIQYFNSKHIFMVTLLAIVLPLGEAVGSDVSSNQRQV